MNGKQLGKFLSVMEDGHKRKYMQSLKGGGYFFTHPVEDSTVVARSVDVVG